MGTYTTYLSISWQESFVSKSVLIRLVKTLHKMIEVKWIPKMILKK